MEQRNQLPRQRTAQCRDALSGSDGQEQLLSQTHHMKARVDGQTALLRSCYGNPISTLSDRPRQGVAPLLARCTCPPFPFPKMKAGQIGARSSSLRADVLPYEYEEVSRIAMGLNAQRNELSGARRLFSSTAAP